MALALAGMVGCSSTTKVPRSEGVQILLHVPGGVSLTPEQLTHVHAALAAELSKKGLHVAADFEVPDYVADVTFTPDGVKPNSGRITINALEAAQWPGKSNYAKGKKLAEARANQQDLESWARSNEAPTIAPQ